MGLRTLLLYLILPLPSSGTSPLLVTLEAIEAGAAPWVRRVFLVRIEDEIHVASMRDAPIARLEALLQAMPEGKAAWARVQDAKHFFAAPDSRSSGE